MSARVWLTVTLLACLLASCKTTQRSAASQLKETAESANPYCQAQALATRAFVPAPESEELGSLAADFEVQTTSGPFRLSSAYSGCDTYLIIQDQPRQARESKTLLWQNDAKALLKALPRNTHVLFVSLAQPADLRQASLSMIQEQIQDAYKTMKASDSAHWRDHLHFVTQAAAEIPGWLGHALVDPAWGIGIDRFQKIRYIGNFGDPSRYQPELDDFGPNLAMLANEAIYYNFEAEREARLASEIATLVPVFRGETVADKQDRIFTEIELPDAKTLAGFDTLELDLTAACKGKGEVGDCPAWDEAFVFYLCPEDKSQSCTTELGRWISTYHRRGRWVHDVSPLLPLLAKGGKQRFAFKFGQPYQIYLTLRFQNRSEALKPVATTLLYQETFGANFDLNYNQKRSPLKVSIPATAKRVELVSVITGHGMQEPGNCAEFCNTTHRFTINGSVIERSFPETADSYGCLKEVARGTVPNQFGTWYYGRSGWCPGREVPLVRHDITRFVVPGKESTFGYEGLFEGKPYPAGGAGFLLTAGVVVYE